MKLFSLVLLLFLMLNTEGMQAQCLKIINSSHSVINGGRAEGKMDRFEIKIKKNDRYNYKYLKLGDVIVNLEVYHHDDVTELRGFYKSDGDNLPQIGSINAQTQKPLDFAKAYLYYTTKKSETLKKKRIKIFTKEVNIIETLPQ